MDTNGTGQLSNTSNRKLNLFAGSHNQITELINYHNDVWHIAMTSTRRNLAINKLLVVFLDITGTDFLKQVIACVHQFTE